MRDKWNAFRDSMSFYVAMAVCLAIIGVSSWLLLVTGKDAKTPPETDVPAAASARVPAAVSAPAAESRPEQKQTEKPAPAAAIGPVTASRVELPEAEEPVPPVTVPPEPPRAVMAPLDGEVVAAFSVDALLYSETLGDWRTHDGVDLAAGEGDPVLAACAGTVSAVENDPLMGVTVRLRHDGGYVTSYANLRTGPEVEAGQQVAAGQVLGRVGATAAAESALGPHLHFSVTKDGEPVDPHEFLNG